MKSDSPFTNVTLSGAKSIDSVLLPSFFKFASRDFSTWALLLSNLSILVFYIKGHWELGTILWIYWSQSVIIGFFNFFRILTLKDFSTEGFRINKRPVKPTKKTKIKTAYFFAFHYGFFHFIYAIFLSTEFKKGAVDLKHIFLVAGILFANHLFSFIYNKNRDTKKQNIGTVMFFPYARIIPMHLMILIGQALRGIAALTFFIILKTIADVIMHVVEHKRLRS